MAYKEFNFDPEIIKIILEKDREKNEYLTIIPPDPKPPSIFDTVRAQAQEIKALEQRYTQLQAKARSSQAALERAKQRITFLELQAGLLQHANDVLSEKVTNQKESLLYSDPQGYFRALGVNLEFLRTLPESEVGPYLESMHRLAARVMHPDRGGNTEVMKVVNIAYDYLKDPLNRKNYLRRS